MRINWILLIWSPLLLPMLWLMSMTNSVYWVTMKFLNDLVVEDED